MESKMNSVISGLNGAKQILARHAKAFWGILAWSLASPAYALTPTLPNIPAYTTNVTQAPYNAKGDGATDNTSAIQTAINDVSSHGGGTVRIPGPGIYMSGPLTMKSSINLQIESGAILRMQPYATWNATWSTTPLLSLSSLHDVEISGGGAIDGQGAAWWAQNPGSGLYMIYFKSCNPVLIQNITVSNAPAQQIVFKSSKGGNITIQGITIRAPSSHASSPSHNTDGIDLVGTNCLVQNCDISTGDDNIALGSSTSGVPAADILVTNCTFGDGHGMSIGSNTAGGVSNLTVINCTFNGTDYGIRMKSDNLASGGSGQGGIAQNLRYYNLGMTNLKYFPISIHSYYKSDSDPTGITPAAAAAAAIAPATTNTAIWQNIVISNLTATVAAGGEAGIIWGRTELPAANITLIKLNITAPANFKLYNVSNLCIVDSRVQLPPTSNTCSLYNARLTLTNSTPATNSVSLDGVAGTNALALYNTLAAMTDSTAIGANPMSLSASTLSNSTSLTLSTPRVLNFALGTNVAAVAVAGNLTLNSTLNFTNAAGFGPGTYTLFTYTGSLAGNPALGTQPPGYHYYLDTSVPHQVKLAVGTPPTFDSIHPASGGAGLTFSGSGGSPNSLYFVLASTNLSLPISQWPSIATNQFDAGSRFLITLSIDPSGARRFYSLRLQ